ncbi:hypothetical protein LSTR_LSTR001862 [Laodelphax striatellus]|uniref:Uncharacterized protein n=1 Tax=Laodelphax striatellus TaxID=195883 RepID=A0A482WG06_LAOST|nr:hypothetical protein LSTR_LSTR001862 [Laodelphax striatellus]
MTTIIITTIIILMNMNSIITIMIFIMITMTDIEDNDSYRTSDTPVYMAQDCADQLEIRNGSCRLKKRGTYYHEREEREERVNLSVISGTTTNSSAVSPPSLLVI